MLGVPISKRSYKTHLHICYQNYRRFNAQKFNTQLKYSIRALHTQLHTLFATLMTNATKQSGLVLQVSFKPIYNNVFHHVQHIKYPVYCREPKGVGGNYRHTCQPNPLLPIGNAIVTSSLIVCKHGRTALPLHQAFKRLPII